MNTPNPPNGNKGISQTEPAEAAGLQPANDPSMHTTLHLPVKTDMPHMPRPQLPDSDNTGNTHQLSPGVGTRETAWKQQVGTIKIAWGQLAEHQLLKAEGQEQKLAVLRLQAEHDQPADQTPLS